MRIVRHPNIVELKAFYYSNGERVSSEPLGAQWMASLTQPPKKDEVYLNLVLEFVPETVYRASRHFNKMKTTMPILEVKLYIYQLFRSLAYIHSQGICHRDIKPQNLLLDPNSGILKLCDFGSAKILIENEPNVSYICSRYYRAPELIFGATNYTTKIGSYRLHAHLSLLPRALLVFPLLSVSPDPCLPRLLAPTMTYPRNSQHADRVVNRCLVNWLRHGRANAWPTPLSGRVGH